MADSNKKTTATLIFPGERLLALPRFGELTECALARVGVEVTERRETELLTFEIVTPACNLVFDLSYENDTTRLEIESREISGGMAEKKRRELLILALVEIVRNTTAVQLVILSPNKRPLSRAEFLSVLEARGAAQQAAPRRRAVARDGNSVIQRRPTSQRTAPARRGTAAQSLPALRSQSPLKPVAAPTRSAATRIQQDQRRRRDTAQPRRYDAHVIAYEAARSAELRAALPFPDATTPRRRPHLPDVNVDSQSLSAWAVSLNLAVAALPMALPLLAYNLRKGADLRVSSLAMGVCGLFLALENSGMMASFLHF